MEKLLAVLAAAQLTAAALADTATSEPDPELKLDATRNHNLQTWETFRSFYHGLVGALNDSKAWPEPVPQKGTPNAPGAPQTTPGGSLGGSQGLLLEAGKLLLPLLVKLTSTK